MVHSDDKGLILPPELASTKVIIIPCGINKKTSKQEEQAVYRMCGEICNLLNEFGVSTRGDNNKLCLLLLTQL